MNRLTKRYASHIAVVCDNCKEKGSHCNESACRDVMRNRLAEYEDAEEQGLLVRLPCKLGDTVWFIRPLTSKKEITETIVEKIVVKEKGIYMKLACNALYETSCKSIGKTVFLTREAAEKALEEVCK